MNKQPPSLHHNQPVTYTTNTRLPQRTLSHTHSIFSQQETQASCRQSAIIPTESPQQPNDNDEAPHQDFLGTQGFLIINPRTPSSPTLSTSPPVELNTSSSPFKLMPSTPLQTSFVTLDFSTTHTPISLRHPSTVEDPLRIQVVPHAFGVAIFSSSLQAHPYQARQSARGYLPGKTMESEAPRCLASTPLLCKAPLLHVALVSFISTSM